VTSATGHPSPHAEDATGAPRRPWVRRSPADVLRVVVAAVVVVVLLLVEWWFGDTLVAFASDLLRGLDAVPRWIIDVVVVGTRVVVLALLAVGLFLVVRRSRWRVLLTTATAAVAAIAVFAALDALVEPAAGLDPVDVDDAFGVLGTDGAVSSAAIAAVAAVLAAVAPWLGRRVREAGWLLGIGLVVTSFVQAPASSDAVLALAVGWMCGAAVLVVGGAPDRRPTAAAVIGGLAAVGLAVERLDRAGVDARGSTPYFGVAPDGSRLFVKALGADERSADLLFRLYRRLLPHDLGDDRPFGSLKRSVEHEAFVALHVAALGLPTPPLRAIAAAEPGGWVLAYDAIAGRSLDRLGPAEVTDDVLAAIWRLVGQLRAHRIAHRDLRLANVFVDDGGDVWLIDFGFSEVAASDLLLATDVAELLASSSVCVGATRAVEQAVRAVDPATAERAVRRLRTWGLSGATRAALAERPGLLDELRTSLAARAREHG
jgi:tRNA A-37 threonylcarbamoyl transferase component Bud32